MCGTPKSLSYVRNDVTDSANYDDIQDEQDTSIGRMKMIFDKSIDMSVMEDEKNISFPGDQSKILKTIAEIEEDDKEIKLEKSTSKEDRSSSQ